MADSTFDEQNTARKTAEEPTTAVAKAFRLLEALTATNAPAQLADLAEAADMPKPSAHRMLAQLEEIGIVKRDATGKRHMVGPALQRLAVSSLWAMARAPAVLDIMRKLVAEVGESSNFGILDGREVVYLERVESDFPLRLHLAAGARVPAHCTAVGKLFLAELPSGKRKRLLAAEPVHAYTPNTLTDLTALEAQLAEIRSTGISINREEYVEGLIGVAVPVRDRTGQLVAGVSLHAPSFRLSAAAAMAHVPRLREAAAELREELGL